MFQDTSSPPTSFASAHSKAVIGAFADLRILEIRAEIERHITRREQISTSMEIPLAAECKKVLSMAAEEADRLAHRHLETEHLLLGMLRLEGSLAAQILSARSVNPGMIREQLAKSPVPTIVKAQPAKQGFLRLDRFLAGLRWHKSEELAAFFAKNAQFADAAGKRRNREEVEKQFETLIAPMLRKTRHTQSRESSLTRAPSWPPVFCGRTHSSPANNEFGSIE